MKTNARCSNMFAIVTGLLLAAVPSASATTFTVTNALPQGPGSLRDAVEQSNFDILSSNTVVFAIPGTGPHTITLTSATGNTIAVTAPVVIDGTTQDGYQPWRPAVKIFVQEEAPENFTGLGCMALFNGSVTVRGLTFESRNSVELQLSREGGDRVEACVFGSEDGQESPYAYPCISMYETRGSVVGSAAPGMGNIFKTKLGNTISMYRVQDTVVIGNYFGIDPLTAAVYRCGHTVIRMTDTLNCRVGGAALGERNIIAAGTFAVSVAGFPEYGGGSEGNTVIGNYIGTDASGTSRTGLVGTGIEGLGAQNLRVGGAAPGEGNVIVAGNRGLNTGQCVLIHQVSSDAVVQGNIFGLASDGVTTVGDGNWGVVINESSNAMIGGAAPGAGNIIGDQLYGITLSGSGTTGNRVQGNKVGVGSDGVTPRGCPGSGISLARNANGNQIGGILPGEGNIVAYNGARYGYGGVTFSYAVNGNSVLGNSIHSNEGLGIRLGLSNFGVPIANDPGDADTGENNWQNHPVLTFAGTDATATATSVTGVLDSQPSQPYRVEFFVNDDCDPMGHGEGREFLTAINVTTDELGRAPLVVTLPTVIAAGRIITATATDNAGNTSEFGPCRTVTVASADIAVTPGALSFGPALANGGSTTFTLMVRNQGTLPLNFIGPGFTFDGPDADQFALAGTPSIAALAPGASRAVGVVFAPTRVGLVSARLVVTSDDPADPEIRVALAGTGVATAAEVPRPYDGASTGTSTIGPAGATYASLKAACDAVNAGPPLSGGDWTFLILADLDEPFNSQLAQDTRGNRLVIRPAAGISPVVTFLSDIANPYYGGHLLVGSKHETTATGPRLTRPTRNVVIDGNSATTGPATRNLTLRNTSGAGGRTHILNVVGDSDGFRLLNANVQSLYNGGASNYGLQVLQVYDPANGVTDAIPDDLVVENCLITNTTGNACQAVAVRADAQSNVPVCSRGSRGLVFRGNSIAARARSFFFANAQEAVVEHNDVRLNQTSVGVNSFGVLMTDLGNVMNDVRMVVRDNQFQQIHAATNTINYGPRGMAIEYGGTGHRYDIVNNMIGGLQLTGQIGSNVTHFSGIAFSASTDAEVNILHNSIDMLPSVNILGTAPTVRCFGIGVTGTGFTGRATVRNNVVRMGQPGGSAIARETFAGTFDSDFNCLHAVPGALVARNGSATTYATLADWQAASGADRGSISLDPSAANPPGTGRWANPDRVNSDLHFTADPGPAFNGTPLAAVRTDRDGDARALVLPLMGADETPRADFGGDSDGDGVLDSIEALGPGGGDADNDGTSDSLQSNVAAVPNSLDGRYVVVVSEVGTTLTHVTSRTNPAYATAPSGFTYPLGFLGFTVLGVPVGGVATVQLILPVGTIADTFRRYGPTPADPADHWYAFDFDGVTGTGATFAGNTVTLKIRDGAAGDDDLTANGQVTDPGAPAIGPAAAVASWELY